VGNGQDPFAVEQRSAPGLSGRRDRIVRVSQQDQPLARRPADVPGLHLVLGDEELLVERAVAEVLRGARKQAGTDDVPVDRLGAGEVSINELAELLSPSLFADERVVVLEAAAEAGKDAVALIAGAAADLPPGTLLVVVHSGGGRAKALAGQLRDLGAQVHPCARITRASQRADFVRAEFGALRVTVSDDTITALLDAVGSDIRELASACSQLVADTDGAVDAAAVRRYHSGKAEVSGFDIADKVVVGDVAGAAEALRWALMRGVAHVLIADALAEAVHTIAVVGPRSGDPYRLASELGMPPWRVQKAQKQSRRWSRDSVATAMRLVATLNADVKGAAADADYALESAVRRVAELIADGER
jgi:DNA polymerase III subunit delta